MGTGAMLEVRSITVGYGDLTVVHDVSVHVERGEVVAMIGANGAGKTTIQRAVLALEPLRTGSVLFEGRDLAGLRTHDIVKLGLVAVPANARVFGKFSVKDNLLMGSLANPRAGRSFGEKLEQVHALFPVLAHRSSQRADTLSGGERQMLAMGRALMADPKLLIMDEPTAGLAPKLAAEVFRFIARMRDLNLTCLVVEEKVDQVLAIASRAYVIQNGRVVLEGAAADVRRSDLIVSAYTGARAARSAGAPLVAPPRPLPR